MGTEGYMAPEQGIDASAVDERADVYGLGVTLWVLIAAQDPLSLFREGSIDDLPAPLQPVVRKALAPNPDKRHESVQALADALVDALPELPEDPPETPSLGLARPPEEIDGYREILPLLDGMSEPTMERPSQVSRPSAIPGYVMPQVGERSASLPDWVADEGVTTPQRERRTVGVDPAPRPTPWSENASVESEGRRKPDPTMSPSPVVRRDEPDALTEAMRTVSAAIGMPVQVALLGLLLLVVAAAIPLGLGHLQMAAARDALEGAQVDLHEAMLRETGLVAELVTLGANEPRLGEAWSAMQGAPDLKTRTQRALDYLAVVHLEADQVRTPGTVTWENAEERIQRLDLARRALVQEHQAYLASEDSFLGWIAFAVRPAQVPELRGPAPGLSTAGSVERR